MFSLEGKTAVITGASQGIGQAIAEVFAEAGANVFLCGLNDGLGDNVAAGIVANGGKAQYRVVDITAGDDARSFVNWAFHDTGRLDILVNNASYTSGAQHDVVGATDDEWEKNFRVGLMGTHYCTQAAVPHMRATGGGSIIVISSIQALAGCPSSAPYSTIKAGQLGFVKCTACDYGLSNIRVNAICPGPIQVAYSPKPGTPGYDFQVKQTMLGRVAQPREIGHAALYLASDEASFVTGVTLPVDGGWTAK
jgi:NAD(P)-dependent dehydrogenase (short-subunit alcohol dehydrogenase family)